MRLSRRTLLAAGAALAMPAAAQAPAFSADFSTLRALPARLRLARPGPATCRGARGTLEVAGADVARFEHGEGGAGLLAEGAMRNLVAHSVNLAAPTWTRGRGVRVDWDARMAAPDGSAGAARVTLAPGRPSGLYAEMAPGPTDAYGTASFYVRAAAGRRGRWAFALADGASQRVRAETVEVDEQWRRVSVAVFWEYRDTGPKRLHVVAPADSIPADSLREVHVWGAQYEGGNAASSWFPTEGGPAVRAADTLMLDGALGETPEGALRFHLPAGGRRDGVLLDAPGGLMRLDYSPSGFLRARRGRLACEAFGEATEARWVEIAWSRRGLAIRTGATAAALATTGSVLGDPGPVTLTAGLRLAATTDGSRPLNRPLGALATAPAPAIAATPLPRLIPATYRLSFADEFDDADLSRLNENGTGGRPGAPAWRSRYHHPREDIINGEKQIYVDPQYAGTSGRPMGVQPFEIRDSVLRISARPADPVRVRPYIGRQLYTSGVINSENTFWQMYGHFEMRAKLPAGKGFWPAFWLLPKAHHWPPEIDIFECSGARRMSVHPGAIWAPGQGNGRWYDDVIDIADGFHVYACEWTREHILFFVDGRRIHTSTQTFHEEMYILANLGCGSHEQNWIPDPDQTTPFPGVYEIDYIRVHARSR